MLSNNKIIKVQIKQFDYLSITNIRKQTMTSNSQSGSIQSIFEQDFHTCTNNIIKEIFYSRCQDTGDKADREKAKMFK